MDTRLRIFVSWILDIHAVYHGYKALCITNIDINVVHNGHQTEKLCIMDTRHKHYVSWTPTKVMCIMTQKMYIMNNRHN